MDIFCYGDLISGGTWDRIANLLQNDVTPYNDSEDTTSTTFEIEPNPHNFTNYSEL